MIKPFDFFFDFISPYSYLAHKQIRKLEKENNIKINYKPILLGGLHKLAGVTAAAFIPSKTKYTKGMNAAAIATRKFPISKEFLK